MNRRRGVQATLAMRVLVRLGWTALAVIVANIVYALSHNLFDANHLAENIVRGEAQRIALRVAASVGADQVDREEAVPEPDGVSFRVIDPNRTILAERNGALVDRASTLNAQNLRNAVFQVSHVTMDGEDYIWGVARHQIGGRQALVEITLPADMQRAAWHAVTDELSLHVWVPLIPSALLFLLLAHWSVHSGLEPLSRAVNAIKGAEVVRGPPPKLAAERFTSEIGNFLFEVEAAFSKHGVLLRAQQEFVGRVAHELRTPLTLMARDLASVADPKARAIQHEVNQLSNKVSMMLAWARMDIAGLKHEPIDLAEIAVAAAAQLRPLGNERGIAIELRTTGEAVTSGDGGLVKEAVHNMIENAIKHTPAGSRVVVTSGPGPRISVADNGAGFPKVDDLLLLQPFWKGDASTAGAGLGLALVKRVADSHGARVLLGSSQDGGAEICLNFRPPQPARA